MNFLENLKSLKKLFNDFIPQQKSRPRGWQSRRLTQFETLESRELLAVNVLGPVAAYAQPNNPAEIQFDLTTNGNTATKFDFTVQRSSGSTLDPSQLRLINRSNGQSVMLSDIVNGTTSSSGSAMLATGSYSVFVSADGGKGNFTFVISQDSPVKTGLDILVMAAIAQQQQSGSWTNRVAYYNNLLANTSYAGAASATPIAKYYPEVDANRDGKIDTTDSAAAKQNAGLVSGSVNSYTVAKNDPVPEIIQGNGNNNVTVPSNHQVQSVAGQELQTGQSKILPNGQGTITLKADGSLAFTPGSDVTQLAQGETETISVPVVTQDIYGNEYAFAAVFTVTGQNELPVLTDSTPISFTFNQTAGSGTVKTAEILKRWTDTDHGAKLSVVNPVIQTASSSNPELQSKYTPEKLKQYLSLTNAGITFTVSDSFFDELGLDETLTITMSYGVKDEYGQSPNTGTLLIIVKGKDNPSVLTAKQTVFSVSSNDINNPVKTINAGFSVTDSDRKDATGFIYSFSNVKDNSTTAANGLITGFNTTNGTFNIDTSKLKNRSIHSAVTVDVSVKSATGGIVSKTLTINLTPLSIPVASPLTLTTTETSPLSGKVIPAIVGTAGFKTTGLNMVNEKSFGTLPNNVSLATVASLDENGNFIFNPGKNFEYLKQGESLKLKFQYTITDQQYGLTNLGTIELTITGTATAPTGLSNPMIGENGKFNGTEINGEVPSITVPKSDILNGWTLPDGLDAYSIVTGTPSFIKWSGGTINLLDSVSFGSVNFDSGNNLVFYPASENYKKLGKGQWLDVAVPVSVRDASGVTYSIGNVLFRIHGSNNAPTLTCQYDKFSFASNSNEAVSINPVFTSSDPDLNDTYWNFDIDSDSKELGFNIDTNTGIISIQNTDKNNLDNGDYKITVSLKDNYGGTTTKDINVQVFKESNPSVSDIIINKNENDSSVELNLNTAIKGKTGHSYSIDTPTLKQILFNGDVYTLDDQYDITITFNKETGVFSFIPQQDFLKFLTTDDTLSFQFEYTVSDNGYVNCQSTASLIVNITGVNDLPIQTLNQNQTIENVTESIDAQPITIDNILAGWSDADHSNGELKISELKISNVNILGLEGNAPIQLNELQQAGPALFTISNDGRNLTFNPADKIFRKLGFGENITLTVSYTVTDPKGGSGTGNFTITVNGNNDPPELDFGNFTWQFKESDESETIDLKEYVTDLDKNDSHRVIKINGTTVSINNSIALENGATVTYLGDLKIKYKLNGQFEYLSKDQTASDTLSITITDGQTGSTSTETLNITITGENDDPTIIGGEAFSVTNSGVDAGDTINIGRFEITDTDTNDTLTRSINVTGATKNGKSLSDFPQCFKIDQDGKVTITNTGLPDLAPGESATFTVVISVDDSHTAITKTIAVTVYAKNLPDVKLIDNNDEVTKIDIAEDEHISKSLTISVADTKEEFTTQRIGNDWYTANLSVSVPEKYNKEITNPSSYFRIVGDTLNGYTLNFNAEANTFDFLKEEETLTFTVIVSVTDTLYKVTETKELALTVTGKGDNHTVSNYTSSFDFWANEKNPVSANDRDIDNENNTVIFTPNYQITDNDWNENYQYKLIGNNSAEISIDETTGNITLCRNNLTTATTYALKVRVSNMTDGHYEDIEVTINIKLADNPVVSETLTDNINETDSITKIIVDVTKPTDNAVRNEENWYQIDNLTLKGYEGIIPNEFDIATNASEAACFEGNTFTFNSDTNFDFLPLGSSLTLTYEFTVFDTKFDVETTKEITITINGQNTKPEWIDVETKQLGECDATDASGESEVLEIPFTSITTHVKEVDLDDSLSLSTINGIEINENTWFEITDNKNNSLGEFYYASATNNLSYRATGEYLAKLRHNDRLDLSFSFVVKDNSGAETESKNFTITVIGTNKPPVVSPDIPPFYKFTPNDTTKTINVSDIAKDINENDKLSFYSINGTELMDIKESGDEIIVKANSNGIQILFNKKKNTITITVLDTYDWDTFTESTLKLNIGVNDDSGAEENYRSIIPITIYLTNDTD